VTGRAGRKWQRHYVTPARRRARGSSPRIVPLSGRPPPVQPDPWWWLPAIQLARPRRCRGPVTPRPINVRSPQLNGYGKLGDELVSKDQWLTIRPLGRVQPSRGADMQGKRDQHGIGRLGPPRESQPTVRGGACRKNCRDHPSAQVAGWHIDPCHQHEGARPWAERVGPKQPTVKLVLVQPRQRLDRGLLSP
jgi:hypothetical protein